VDAGATATDVCDGGLTSKIVTQNTVNTAAQGTYVVTYNVHDAAGNAAVPVTRTVKVVVNDTDAIPPVINLTGSSYIRVRVGRPFVDPGATAQDNVDGDITAKIVRSGVVNTARSGVYKMTYSVTDSAGNVAKPALRIVCVTIFAKAEEDNAEVLIASPVDGATYTVSPGQTHVPLTLSASAPGDTQSIDYTFDGTPVGSSAEPPYAVTVELDLAVLQYGEHQVGATAHRALSEDPLSAQSAFTLALASADMDANGNALPDNPFTTLPLEGDTWIGAASVAETGGTRVAALTRFESMAEDETTDIPVVLTAGAAAEAARNVTVSVPRGLLAQEESGIVLVTAADSLETLLGSSEATALQPEPEGRVLASGGQYVLVSVLVTRDGGITFDEIDEARLADSPITVTFRGIEAPAGTPFALYRHPALIDSDATTGVMAVAAAGAWTTAGVYNVVTDADSTRADLTSLSVLALYQSSDTGKNNDGTGCAGASLDMPRGGGRGGDMLMLALAATLLIFMSNVTARRALPARLQSGHRTQ
jgi:hypothetical protein